MRTGDYHGDVFTHMVMSGSSWHGQLLVVVHEATTITSVGLWLYHSLDMYVGTLRRRERWSLFSCPSDRIQ